MMAMLRRMGNRKIRGEWGIEKILDIPKEYD